MTLGEGLKRFREARGLSQQQMANAAETFKPNYQRYEHDKTIPAASVLIKIADAYNVSLDYLTGRSDNPKRL